MEAGHKNTIKKLLARLRTINKATPDAPRAKTHRTFFAVLDRPGPRAILHVMERPMHMEAEYMKYIRPAEINKFLAKEDLGAPVGPSSRVCAGDVTFDAARKVLSFSIKGGKGLSANQLQLALKGLKADLGLMDFEVSDGATVVADTTDVTAEDEVATTQSQQVVDELGERTAWSLDDDQMNRLLGALDDLAARGEDYDAELLLRLEADLERRERLAQADALLEGALGKPKLKLDQEVNLHVDLPRLLDEAAARLDLQCRDLVYPLVEGEVVTLNSRVGRDDRQPTTLTEAQKATALRKAASELVTAWMRSLKKPKDKVSTALKTSGALVDVLGAPFLLELDDRTSPRSTDGRQIVLEMLMGLVQRTHPAHAALRRQQDLLLGRDPETPLVARSQDEIPVERLQATATLADPRKRGQIASVRSRGFKNELKWARSQIAAVEDLVDAFLAFTWGPGASTEPLRMHRHEDVDIMLDWVQVQLITLREGAGGKAKKPSKSQTAALEYLEREGLRLLKKVKAAPIDPAGIAGPERMLHGTRLDMGQTQHDLGAQIGQGAAATVYLGTMTTPEGVTNTAIRMANWDDPEDLAGALKESDLGRRLDHPNVVKVLDVQVVQDPATTKTRCMVVMERADSDCEALCNPGDHVPMAQRAATAMKIAKGALRGLSYMHAKGWMHADIKPANLLAFGDEIKLTDLGEAHDLGAGPLSDQRGSKVYQAPEASHNATGAGARADAWSLGVTLFEALDGPHLLDKALGFNSFGHYAYEIQPANLTNLLNRVAPLAEAHQPGLGVVLRGLLVLDPSKRMGCAQALDVLDHVGNLYEAVQTWTDTYAGGVADRDAERASALLDHLGRSLQGVPADAPELAALLDDARRILRDGRRSLPREVPSANGYVDTLEQSWALLAAPRAGFLQSATIADAVRSGKEFTQALETWLQELGQRPHQRRKAAEDDLLMTQDALTALVPHHKTRVAMDNALAHPDAKEVATFSAALFRLPDTAMVLSTYTDTATLAARTVTARKQLEEDFEELQRRLDAAFDVGAVKEELLTTLRKGRKRYRTGDGLQALYDEVLERYPGHFRQVSEAFYDAAEETLGTDIRPKADIRQLRKLRTLWSHQTTLLEAGVTANHLRDVLYGIRSDRDGTFVSTARTDVARHADDLLAIWNDLDLGDGLQDFEKDLKTQGSDKLSDLRPFADQPVPDAGALGLVAQTVLNDIVAGKTDDVNERVEQLMTELEPPDDQTFGALVAQARQQRKVRHQFAMFPAPGSGGVGVTTRVYLQPKMAHVADVSRWLARNLLKQTTAYPGVSYFKVALGGSIGRNDRIVLYLGKVKASPQRNTPEIPDTLTVPPILDLLHRLGTRHKAWFDQTGIILMDELVPGIGVTKDAPNSGSYNELLGECLHEALQHATSEQDFKDRVAEAYKTRGYDPDHPGRPLRA